MAHPFQQARHTDKSRVRGFLKSGGVAHSDAAADKKLIRQMLKRHEKEEGDKHGGRVSAGRLDKSYARGGRTKKAKGKTNIQINIHKDKPELPPVIPPPTGLGLPPPTDNAGASAAPIVPPPAPAGAAPMPPPSPMKGGMKRGGKVKMAGGGGMKAMKAMRPMPMMRPQGMLKPMKAVPGVKMKGMKTGGVAKRQYGGPLVAAPRVVAPVAPRVVAPIARGLAMKKGGYVSGVSTKENLNKWAKYAEKGSPPPKRARGGRMTGGAETGVGRLEKIAKYGKRARGS